MQANFKYLSYVLRHKWFVFLACLELKVPLHIAVLHDISKLYPCEWIPYTDFFYRGAPSLKTGAKVAKVPTMEFQYAWNHHQKSNKHHWQYWILQEDENYDVELLEIPEVYLREMVADWIGAGRAIKGIPTPRAWYAKNIDKIKMNPKSRKVLESILGSLGSNYA